MARRNPEQGGAWTNRIAGIYAAAVTPFDADGNSLSLGALGVLLNFFESEGLTGALVLGTTGEFASLSHSEKLEMIGEAGATKGNLKLLVGCSSTALPETIALIRAAERKNASAVLVTPPYYFRSASEKGIEDFFSAVLNSTSLPVILYHIPSHTGIEITPGLMERLARFENLWGLKDTGGKLQETSRFLANPPGRVLLGSDQLLGSGLKLGVHGGITACANIAPKLVGEIFHEHRRGADTTEGQEVLTNLRSALKNMKLHASIKTILCARGIPVGGVRPPLGRLSPDEAEYVKAVASTFHLL